MSTLTPKARPSVEGLFAFSEAIKSVMVVDRIGNLVSFSSRATRPVDSGFVSEIAAKGTALLGGILRANETSFGVLEWVHLRYRKLHVYCWLVDEGYLVFTSRSQLPDSLLHRIGTMSFLRARYAEFWEQEREEVAHAAATTQGSPGLK